MFVERQHDSLGHLPEAEQMVCKIALSNSKGISKVKQIPAHLTYKVKEHPRQTVHILQPFPTLPGVGKDQKDLLQSLLQDCNSLSDQKLKKTLPRHGIHSST